MKRVPVIEIDFAASLVENGAGLLQAKWQRILTPARIRVEVAGVFCHQSPMVEMKGTPPRGIPTRRCELADLLILHSHTRSDHKRFLRGVLLQAKAVSGQKVVPDEPQLWLYQDWPSFVITSPGFANQPRDFDCDPRSGMYALVSNNGWQVLPANNPLLAVGNSDLSELLVNMLYDMDTRPRPDGLQALCAGRSGFAAMGLRRRRPAAECRRPSKACVRPHRRNRSGRECQRY